MIFVKILSIGNSFSEDATAYLHKISEAGNCPIDISNLYIGGCSLHMHACNIKSNEKKYRLEYNGIYTDRTVSVNEMLKTDSWDIVTVQQASYDSGVLSSYGENGKYVVDYIRNTAPHSEIYFHETWSYEEGSDHPAFGKYGFSSSGMYSAIKSASEKFCSENGNIPIIPCGEVINELRGKKEFDVLSGGERLCRDGYHMSLFYGRYTLAAVWFEIFTGKDIRKVSFFPDKSDIVNGFEIPDGFTPDDKKIKLIKNTVHNVCSKYLK